LRRGGTVSTIRSPFRVNRMKEVERPCTRYKGWIRILYTTGPEAETHSRVEEMRNSLSRDARRTRRGRGAAGEDENKWERSRLLPPPFSPLGIFSSLIPFSLSFIPRIFRRSPFFPLCLAAVVFFARALLRAPPLRRSILVRARTSAQVNLYENGCRMRCRRW